MSHGLGASLRLPAVFTELVGGAWVQALPPPGAGSATRIQSQAAVKGRASHLVFGPHPVGVEFCPPKRSIHVQTPATHSHAFPDAIGLR